MLTCTGKNLVIIALQGKSIYSLLKIFCQRPLFFELDILSSNENLVEKSLRKDLNGALEAEEGRDQELCHLCELPYSSPSRKDWEQGWFCLKQTLYTTDLRDSSLQIWGTHNKIIMETSFSSAINMKWIPGSHPCSFKTFDFCWLINTLTYIFLSWFMI